MKKPTCLFINNSPQPGRKDLAKLGGGGKSLLALLADLPAHGWDSHVVVPGEGQFTDALVDMGIPHTIFPFQNLDWRKPWWPENHVPQVTDTPICHDQPVNKELNIGPAQDHLDLIFINTGKYMNVTPQLLFVTGFPRSGTSWSNSIFYYCFDCGFANEVQFILKFHGKLSKYGDLQTPKNINRLVSDLLSDSYFPLLKEKYEVELQENDILQSLQEHSYAEVVRTILRLVARDLKKSIVGGKCPSLGWDLKTVSSLFPEAKLIHVIRDGRDCALSHYRMSWGLQNAYVAAHQWSKYLREAKSVGTQLGPNRYMEFRYEDLLTNPDRIGRELQQFLYGQLDDQITSCVLEKIKNNALPNNFYKWKKAMPKRDQGIFEAVAGDVLSQCGYDLTGNIVNIGLLEKAYHVTNDRLRRETYNFMRRVWPSLPEKLSKKN